MTKFVLGPDIPKACLVNELVDELKLAARAKFVLEPARDGYFESFSVSRVAATGVRPVVWPESLARSTLLDEQVTLTIEKEYREGAVQDTVAVVTCCFVETPHLPVLGIDEDKRLVV